MMTCAKSDCDALPVISWEKVQEAELPRLPHHCVEHQMKEGQQK